MFGISFCIHIVIMLYKVYLSSAFLRILFSKYNLVKYFLIIATVVNTVVKNIVINKLFAELLSFIPNNVPIHNNTKFKGKFIINANIVSNHASFNACFLSALLIVFKMSFHHVVNL